jgi:hypothetical protein
MQQLITDIWRCVSNWVTVKDRSSFRYIAEERKPHPYRNDIGKTRDLHLVTFRAAGSGYWCSPLFPPTPQKRGRGRGCKGIPDKNLYTKPERLPLSFGKAWAWSERFYLLTRQIIMLPRKTKPYGTYSGPGNFYRLPSPFPSLWNFSNLRVFSESHY